MKKVRIRIENMRKGDVFIAHDTDRVCIVERPRKNMGREYRLAHNRKLAAKRLEGKTIETILSLLF